MSSKSIGARTSSTIGAQRAQRGDRRRRARARRRGRCSRETARRARHAMRMPRTSGATRERVVEIDARRAERRRIVRVGAGHRRGEQRDVLDRVRERPDRVERRRQRHGAVQADEPVRRLEAGEAAQRRGNAHRAAGVRADRRGREAGRDRDRRAARRAARDAMRRQVPRIPRRAHRLVAAPAAERELDHVRLAERNHAGGDQPRRRTSPCDRRCGRASSSIRPSSAGLRSPAGP